MRLLFAKMLAAAGTLLILLLSVFFALVQNS